MTDIDITSADATQADADAQAQEATDDATQADANVNDESEIAKLRSELRATRREAAANRTKLKAYEDSTLSEQQKLEQARSTAEARAQQLETTVRDLQAQVAASKLGVRADAYGDVVRLIDWDEVDDPSDTKQVERAVRAVLKDRPWLSGRPGGLDAGTGNSGRVQTKPTFGSFIRREAGIESS